MFDTVLVFAALIVATLVVAYTAALGRLESRVVLILLPTATILLSALTLIVRADSFLLLAIVGSTMATVAFILMVYAMVAMFKHDKGNATPASSSLGEVDRTELET